MWDLEPAPNPAFFMNALTAYKCTSTHACVVQAVQEAFKWDGDTNFRWLNTHQPQQAQETLKAKLIQTAIDARLCMLHV